jgi:predicted Fe-Mo cluster-binding NifX family protein
MKLAIATENGNVSAHFGHCEKFTIVEIENGTVKSKEEVGSAHNDCGSLPQLLGEKGVQCIIAGGMGARPQQLFASKGIKVIVGVGGSIDEVIKMYIGGRLYAGANPCGHDHGDHPDGKCGHRE